MASDWIAEVRAKLLTWFEAHRRELPWRAHRDPYKIWVSEVMLQQTQVKKVLQYYERFIGQFPNVEALATADLHDVLKAWEGLGYYARIRNLHKAAQAVLRDLGGEIPCDYETFRRLPGVGDYTAAAVLSIAFHQPYAVVDGNVKRVLARLLLIDTPINASGATKAFQAQADRLLDRENPGAFNQAMMELGATVCRPKSPTCLICPVNAACGAFQVGQQEALPVRTKSKRLPEYLMAIGVLHRDDRVLITQRKLDGLLGGLWEFPGGNKEPGETAEQACVRVMREETGLSVEITAHLTQVKHAYTHFRIVADVFRCRYQSGEVVLKHAIDYRWIPLESLDQFALPKSNHKFIHLLQDSYKL